jgi:drug/metabolite transporter (DMT)-like permease
MWISVRDRVAGRDGDQRAEPLGTGVIVAVLAALAAGASFAVGGVLQQRVAATRPSDESLSLSLLKQLARQKLWVAGIAFAFLSYGFQSLALAFGPLSLVQPLILSELLFSLPLSARLYGARLGRQDWLGVLAVGLGLASALYLASPSGGNPRPALTGWLVLLASAGGLAALALVVARRLSGAARASLFALAGGIIMGTQSALLDTSIANLQEGFLAIVLSWQSYAVIVASIGGLLLIQSAFQAGPLSASLPVIDTVQPLVTVAIGFLLFNESFTDSTWQLVGSGVAAVVVVVGIVLLDTSPVMHKLHDKQQETADEQSDDEQVTLGT